MSGIAVTHGFLGVEAYVKVRLAANGNLSLQTLAGQPPRRNICIVLKLSEGALSVPAMRQRPRSGDASKRLERQPSEHSATRERQVTGCNETTPIVGPGLQKIGIGKQADGEISA
jgi:hypothetical protein